MGSLPFPDTGHTSKTNTFGFKTTKSPSAINELREFKGKMLTLVQNIEFKNTNCDFQQQLSQDIRKIRKDKKMIIPADKTTNFYRVDPKSQYRE